MAGTMFAFTHVVVIGFNPSTVKRFLLEQGLLRPGDLRQLLNVK